LISKGAVKIAQNETSVMTLSGAFDLSTPGKINMTNEKTTITGEGGKLTIDSASEINVICGSATMTLKSDGTIVVSGKDVSLKGTTLVELGVGSSAIKVEAAGITVSGPKISSTAVGIHEIQGAVVKVG
jgi:type VI secretion system secreted protein VgrG